MILGLKCNQQVFRCRTRIRSQDCKRKVILLKRVVGKFTFQSCKIFLEYDQSLACSKCTYQRWFCYWWITLAFRRNVWFCFVDPLLRLQICWDLWLWPERLKPFCCGSCETRAIFRVGISKARRYWKQRRCQLSYRSWLFFQPVSMVLLYPKHPLILSMWSLFCTSQWGTLSLPW